MTISLEKVFFRYILKNKGYIFKVEPEFFESPEIKIVYTEVHKYILAHPETEVISGAQIYEMVALVDKEKRITKQILKLLLGNKEDREQYDEEKFIKPNLRAWILREQLKKASDFLIEETRRIDGDELNQVKFEEIAERIRLEINEKTVTTFDDDDDLGSNFNDAKRHVQDHDTLRVKTGFGALDNMLGGGLDVQTLNILMGETNSGKSLWLQNIAAQMANQGKNIVYFTLEMSEAKVLKRLGSMRLKIPINSYDERSKDINFIQSRIDDINSGVGDSMGRPILSKDEIGDINVRFFPAGTATINNFESHLKNLLVKRKFKPDVIIVDYITLMTPIKGLGIENNLYLKGKHLAEALRALGARLNVPVLTVMQIAKDAWNASDITLDKIPESKAIAETADTFWAIIRTEQMKRENRYILKLLKQRDGDFSRSKAIFDLNPKFLTVENDRLLEDDI